MHKAITRETVKACHDLSEGGLAVAAAEMAFAGGLGARIEIGSGDTIIHVSTHNGPVKIASARETL